MELVGSNPQSLELASQPPAHNDERVKFSGGRNRIVYARVHAWRTKKAVRSAQSYLPRTAVHFVFFRRVVLRSFLYDLEWFSNQGARDSPCWFPLRKGVVEIRSSDCSGSCPMIQKLRFRKHRKTVNRFFHSS
uniref:Uncharacterized protein n=1 Tax=Rhodosorus marinus TaxID=101924 RepID=A0A7S2ZVF3_9RHOD